MLFNFSILTIRENIQLPLCQYHFSSCFPEFCNVKSIFSICLSLIPEFSLKLCKFYVHNIHCFLPLPMWPIWVSTKFPGFVLGFVVIYSVEEPIQRLNLRPVGPQFFFLDLG